MNDQNDLLNNDQQKYKRPKAKSNQHLVILAGMGYSTKQLSAEFCHDQSTVLKWLSGEQPAPAWTEKLAVVLMAQKNVQCSKYVISPATKEDESYILSTLERMAISYKKFDF